MRLRSRLVQFASAGVFVAFAASGAFAQGSVGGAGNQPGASKESPGQAPGASGAAGQTGKAGEAAPSQGPWTENNVTSARPFGDINVQPAGTTNDTVRIWAQSRTPSELTELNGRCQVISDPMHSSRYPMDALLFCRTYTTVVAELNPSGGPGAASGGAPGGQLGGSSAAPAGKADTDKKK